MIRQFIKFHDKKVTKYVECIWRINKRQLVWYGKQFRRKRQWNNHGGVLIEQYRSTKENKLKINIVSFIRITRKWIVTKLLFVIK
jgi:hypothetical protein